jgi:hypothetical protein
MIFDIVIRSYHRDFEWLHYCLRSIERFCRGFRDVVLIVPTSSRAKLDWLGLRGTRTMTCRDYPIDYLGQQVTKLHADLVSDADYLCHVDSDWVFTRPCAPHDLLVDGKVAVGMVDYRRLHPGIPWRRATERFLGRSVAHDFMRRQPYMFPRRQYAALRDFCRARHGVDLETWVLRQTPLGFSEFNALAAHAFFHEPEAYAWVEADDPTLDEAPCRAYWSWGGITEAIRCELDAVLASDAAEAPC